MQVDSFRDATITLSLGSPVCGEGSIKGRSDDRRRQPTTNRMVIAIQAQAIVQASTANPFAYRNPMTRIPLNGTCNDVTIEYGYGGIDSNWVRRLSLTATRSDTWRLKPSSRRT